MTEEIKTCNNNQKMSVYCKTCVCKSCEQVAWLEEENAELKRERNKLTKERNKATKEFNDLIIEIIKDVPFTSVLVTGETVKDHLNKLQRAFKSLEEIREMAIYDCQHECSNNSENCTIGSCLEQRIQRKINEVLNVE